MAASTIAERLYAYMLKNRITIAQASRDTGIQYDTLQQILYGRVKAMGVDKFAAIWQAYPDLDAWHVLTGTGTGEKIDSVVTIERLKELRDEVIRSFDKRIEELGG
ncbi:hypothetical protein [Arsenicibacter rosenii]|uniref:HTH cro/C1-type domain-containing protein n=1 Tax=Arsenicibacter rosenii TaxID=1750698 RepID=A0A1S2VEI6_9BACT|nr:hypothetical protein [Arsenicibacter rosenii]OIN56318.1 hypothetical protein BLX24_25120 [Arsenicibacter rosenii]